MRREGDDGPVLFGFSSETNPAPSVIVATYDGFNFKLLWKDTIDQAPGLGLRTIAGPTFKGELIVGANDQRHREHVDQVHRASPDLLDQVGADSAHGRINDPAESAPTAGITTGAVIPNSK